MIFYFHTKVLLLPNIQIMLPPSDKSEILEGSPVTKPKYPGGFLFQNCQIRVNGPTRLMIELND